MKNIYRKPYILIQNLSFEDIALDPASAGVGDLEIGGNYDDYIGDGAED